MHILSDAKEDDGHAGILTDRQPFFSGDRCVSDQKLQRGAGRGVLLFLQGRFHAAPDVIGVFDVDALDHAADGVTDLIDRYRSHRRAASMTALATACTTCLLKASGMM